MGLRNDKNLISIRNRWKKKKKKQKKIDAKTAAVGPFHATKNHCNLVQFFSFHRISANFIAKPLTVVDAIKVYPLYWVLLGFT